MFLIATQSLADLTSFSIAPDFDIFCSAKSETSSFTWSNFSLRSSSKSLNFSFTSSTYFSPFLDIFLRTTLPLWGANNILNNAPEAAPTITPNNTFPELIAFVFNGDFNNYKYDTFIADKCYIIPVKSYIIHRLSIMFYFLILRK